MTLWPYGWGGPEWAKEAMRDGRVALADTHERADVVYVPDARVVAYAVPLLYAEEDPGDGSLGPDAWGVVVTRNGAPTGESERRGELAESLRSAGIDLMDDHAERHSGGRYMLGAVQGYRTALLLGPRPTDPVLAAVERSLAEADRCRQRVDVLRPEWDEQRVLLLRAAVLAHTWHTLRKGK